MCMIFEKSAPDLSESLSEELSGEELLYLEKAVEQFFRWGKLSSESLKKMKAIQNSIQIEEGKELTLDEALDRVLEFYRRFVHYS